MTNKKTKKIFYHNDTIRLCGDSWHSHSVFLRSAFRNDYPPERRCDYFGFRVVCVLSPRTSHLATKDFQS